jgi:hypothetical protein
MVPRIRLPATFALLAGAALVLGPCPARADLEMMLDDHLGDTVTLNATTSTVVTTGTVNVISFSFTPTGLISFNGSIGNAATGWIVNVTTGLTFPIPGQGTLTSPHMDLNSVDQNGGAGGALTIQFTRESFGPTPIGAHFTQDIGGTLSPGWSVKASIASDPTTNLPFGTGGVSASTNFSSPPNAFSGTASTAGIPTVYSQYSLTERVDIHATGAGTVSFDDTVNTSVPEPSSLAICGLAGLGFVVHGLRRRKALGA